MIDGVYWSTHRQQPKELPMNVDQLRVQRRVGGSLAASALASIILLPACVGRIGSGDSKAGTGTGVPPVVVGTGTGGNGAALDCTVPHAAPVPMQLLSADQYDNTVLDTFKVGGDPAQIFGDGDRVFEQLDDTRVQQRADAAAAVAQQAAATMSAWSPCVPPATGDASACETQIINKFGAYSFRHPLSADESAQMKTLFDAGIAEKDFPTGVEWFLTGLLQSPDFLYLIAKPAANEIVGQAVPLAPYEYASRLSYFIWDSLPDDALFAAAAANQLSDPKQRQVQLTRMLGDARFMRGVQGFYSQWLNLGAFSEVARNNAGFTGNVVTALSTSLLMSATQLYSSAAPNLSGLFSGSTYYMNDALRAFYGLTGSGTAFSAVQMSGEGRQGILTHPGLMALLARPDQSSPIERGLFMLQALTCQSMPPPPATLTIPDLAPVQAGLSTRQRLEAHATNPVCNTCHKVFDPLGFALENFDEVGKYRTVDSGITVDTSGTLTLGNELDGPFANGGELLTKMAASDTVKSCFAQQYLMFALSRESFLPEDQCSATTLGQNFAPSGDLKQLVVSIAGTDSFRLRLAEGVAP